MISLIQAIRHALGRDRPTASPPSSRAVDHSGWPELPAQPQVRRRATDPHPWAQERPVPLAQPGVRTRLH
jgi:hypothetical protein